MAGNRKVVLIGAYRAQMLRESVTKSALGLSDVEESTSGATDAVDQVRRRMGEYLSDMEGLFGALDGGDRGGVGAEFISLYEIPLIRLNFSEDNPNFVNLSSYVSPTIPGISL
eukprot:g43617.t1